MLISILPALAFVASLSVASPLPALENGSVKLLGRRSALDKGAFKLADGSINWSYLKDQAGVAKGKYNKIHSHLAERALEVEEEVEDEDSTLAKRYSGTVPLIDNVQYGQDEEYYGPIAIGTPSQYLNVDFDTGSSDLWVPIKQLTASSGYFKNTSSSTYKDTGKLFSIQYGSGAVSGYLATENVKIGPFAVQGQYFGAVTQESSQFQYDPPAGILGLGFQSIAQTRQPPIIQKLIAAGALSQNLFAFHYTRGQTTGSTLNIGATDSTHYSGTIAYTPVTSQTYWEVTASAPTVNGVSVGAGYLTAIDTGTTLIYLPNSVTAAIYAAIPGGAFDSADSGYGSNYYTFPCASSPVVAFTFSGKNYAINRADLSLGTVTYGSTQCVGSIVGMDVTDAYGRLFGITGDSFIKNWYTVFSFNALSGAPAVGFAKNV